MTISRKPIVDVQHSPLGNKHKLLDDSRNAGMECNQHEFWFINSCEELSKHFPCEKGCTVELGNDVPNYVNDASLGSHQTCLVNQKEAKCAAANPSTQRLCPCIPKS